MLIIFLYFVGPKVISRVLTVESVEEITDVLRRPPVIWDNLHANDYDQKRVFLGPYSGRSPDLIPKLRGVLTNPNCEYGANFVAIHTLAQWSRCNVDGKRDPSISKYLMYCSVHSCYQTEFIITFLYFVGKNSHMLSSVTYLYFLLAPEPVDGLPLFFFSFFLCKI